MPRATLQIRGNVAAGHGLPVNVFVSEESTGLFEPGVGEPGLGEEGGPLHGLYINGDVEVYTELHARPRSSLVQRPGILVQIGAVTLDLGNMTGSWSVERALDRPLQSWSFEVPLVNGASPSPLGDPYVMRAPSPGTDEVDIWGVYFVQGVGLRQVKLITGGICDRAPRSGNAKSGWIESLSGTCVGGRAAQTVTMIFPAGHGLPRGRVVKKLLQEAGFTDFRLEDGSPMVKEVQAVDADPISLCQEILDAEGRVLLWDTEGNAINPKLGPGTQSATWTFNEEDILAVGNVEVSFPGDPVTDITMTGSEQVIRDTAEEPCGIVSTTKRLEITAPYAPLYSDHQDSAGVITPETQSTQSDRLVTLQIITEERACGILKRKKVVTWGYYNPQRSRYFWGSGVDVNVLKYLVTEVAPGSSAGDDAPATTYYGERWMPIASAETRYFYDKDGFYGDGVANYFSGGTTNPIFWTISGILDKRPPAEIRTGRKLGEVTVKSGFYKQRWAVKEAAFGLTWADTDYIESMYILGDGDGVGVSAGVSPETFQEVSAEVLLIESNDQNQTLSERTYTKAWMRPQGNDFWYEGDITSSEQNEQYAITGSELTLFSAQQEGFHDESTIRFDERGRFVDQTDETGIQGALPAVEVIQLDDGSDSSLYADTTEQGDFAKEARDGETRTIKVQVVDDFLEQFHLKKTVKSSLSYAENAEELIAACELLIDESAAGQVQIVLPANYLLAGLMDRRVPIHVTHRPTGLDEDMFIRSLHWTGGPKQAHLTTVTGSIYG